LNNASVRIDDDGETEFGAASDCWNDAHSSFPQNRREANPPCIMDRPREEHYFQKAIKANRVMTIHQWPVGAKNDAECQKDRQWLKQDTPGV